jgi:hypothetical protein
MLGDHVFELLFQPPRRRFALELSGSCRRRSMVL